MRWPLLAICLIPALFAQGDRGTLTGTIIDPGGVTARTGTDFKTIAVGWQWLHVRP